ncbi:relaxase/mobilization nuclease domain-containing protein [Porcincola intestinalis]|uniref:relaxase/mobilization nuclease domain-containing protein n=1 Tax=Porcincola intestinalis TaxID=2606632 RepID=UPI0023F2AAB8|nr:relaxase/mobilization nuclease domain-containing protein [Porcincola intestinalis]MCI6767092.1 relaxase/mobilization nuclease domain-containing protein [Lachnospiraceae bacterium]MDD7059284.1 relaxase/mobilization nuclease domain-containing protein [Porcincola intestinalis]MDY5284218.1 relaxase/mobilization nuclease domain-containing protein [Porcincola intestinalis]
MAINKVINKSTKSHGAMKNVIQYVLQEKKIIDGYADIIGPYEPDRITYDDVYQAFLMEKKIWKKDSGRMYAHNIISFHRDEKVTPEECMEIGRRFCDQFFSGHQSLIAVHQDRDHLHIHIVTNTVSYIDGRKLHQSKADLEKQKVFTNQLCKERGLSVAEKGKHFDGTKIEEGEIRGWSKDKYHLLVNEAKKSFVADCAIAIVETLQDCTSREAFIAGMTQRGWNVTWTAKKKHITFMNGNGDKVRDTNISKTFSMNIDKENLIHEFERQNECRLAGSRSDRDREEDGFEQYYREVESAVEGIDHAESVRNDPETGTGDPAAFIRKLDDEEKAARAERDDRRAERRRQSAARESDARDAEQRTEEESIGSRSSGRSR